MIRVQREPFDVGMEFKALKGGSIGVGGSVVFVGTVRDVSDGQDVRAMTLEHYPGMTERALADIERQAHERWPLEEILIVHRYGRLMPGDDIVLVIATSAHRDAAFDACRFLIDWLKTKAPFWKLEDSEEGARWVEAKESDDLAAAKWVQRDS
jgi:molybdopterin synthase catalytic subunit